MKRLSIAVILAGLSLGSAALADEQRVSVEVGGLSCPSCFYIAGDAILSVDSADIVEFIEGEEAGRAVYIVSFDDELATPGQILEAVEGYGYPARIMEEVNS
jgi:periplasmic mercuric ion binding protein